MPKVAELRVVSYTQDHKKRYRVVGPKLLGKPGQKEFRGRARKSRKEAESDLYDERKRLADLLAEIPELSAAEKLDATNALQLARPTGKSLEQLVLIAMAHLEKVESQKTRTLYEAWQAAIDGLTYERASDAHLKTIRETLSVAIRFRLPVLYSDLRDVHAEHIKSWLGKLPLSPVTQAKWLRYAGLVVSRAQADKYVEENVVATITPPKADLKPVTFLSPDEALALLQSMDPRDLPVAALGLFAGLRPESEIVTFGSSFRPILRWEDVDWERKEIHVAAHKTKTAQHRVVPMEPVLIRWLDSVDARKLTGHVGVEGLRRRFMEARTTAKVTWAQDILRHTYATMWLAAYANKTQLAENMGNSVRIINQHYRHPISKSIADEFWTLEPTEG